MVAIVRWKDKDHGQWKNNNVFLGKNKRILDAELWAILEALGIARKKIQNTRNTSMTIFCDSQGLQTIQHPCAHKKNQFLKSLIYQKTKKL